MYETELCHLLFLYKLINKALNFKRGKKHLVVRVQVTRHNHMILSLEEWCHPI